MAKAKTTKTAKKPAKTVKKPAKTSAKNPAKTRTSVHCATCGKAVAESAVGFVCQHFAHGSYLTYEASKPGASGMGDTACTACSILYEDSVRQNDGEPSDETLAEMNIHVVCKDCYQRAAKRNVLTLRKDRPRGYALVQRDVHAALQGMSMKLAAPVGVGMNVKVVFVPIPSKGRDEYEMMWITIKRESDGSYQGLLNNEPRQFAPKILKEGSKVAFDRDHIVAVEV